MPSSVAAGASLCAAESDVFTAIRNNDLATVRKADSTARDRRGNTPLLYASAFGSVEGYPNDLSKLDNPVYRSATSGVGTRTMLYLGGALADWFTFSFGLSRSSYGTAARGRRGA